MEKTIRKQVLLALAIIGAILLVMVGIWLEKGIWFTLGLAAGWLAAMIVVFALSEMLWLRNITRKMDVLLPLVHGDPDRYIKEVKDLLDGVESPSLQQAKNVNLAAAYCQKGAYRVAADLLEKLDPKIVPPAQRSIYWANLALTEFHLNRKKAACSILRQYESSFAPLRSTAQMGPLLAVLEVYRLLAEGEKENAREALAELKDKWPADAIQRELKPLEKLCK